MSFAAPWALAGLVLAGIPILLHLLARREPPTVVFPATRYLADAARIHQRRLQLQHLLLLLLRTLLIVALVTAAAGPSWPAAGVGTHAPTAAVLVLDNSLSSGAIQGGVPMLDGLKVAAGAVLDRATPEDRLWLLTADGVPRQGSAKSLRELIDSSGVSVVRLELGRAVGIAGDLLATADRPGEIILVSDLQRTALAGATSRPGPIAVLRPTVAPVVNAGLSRLTVGSQPWGSDGGAVGIMVTGSGDRARPVSVRLGARPPKQLLVPVGGQGSVHLVGSPGWWTLEASLDPDELRLDDTRSAGVRVAPPARVAWQASDRYLATALEVLTQNGRVTPGSDVSAGSLGGGGAAVVIPPSDPAAVGALNRGLAARGSRWRFGDLELTPTATDSGAWLDRERVLRRHRLTFQGGAASDVLVTVGGEPWAVRSGRIILVGSRFDPEWTTVGSSRVDLQACKLEYSIVSPK